MIMNVLQGPPQGLDQVDAVRPKFADEQQRIERGTLMTDKQGAWHVAMAADRGTANLPGQRIFVALNNDTDADVEFSGKIAGLSADVPGYIFETAAIDDVASVEASDIDAFLTLADGGLYQVGVVNGNTIYGQLKSLPVRRIANNRPRHDRDIAQSVAVVMAMYVPFARVTA